MLTSELTQELGALIRSLETRLRQEPKLLVEARDMDDAMAHIERAIITLIVLYIKEQRSK